MAEPMINFATTPKFCINLARRIDRREHAEQEFKRFGLDVEFVTAVDANDIILPELSIKAHEYYAKGNWACVLSHLSIIKRAQAEYIFICEDDVKFCDDFLERMAIVEASRIEFDIFYVGGCPAAGGLEQIDGHLHRVTGMGGTYAYILRNTTFDFIVRNVTYNWGPDEFYSEVLLKHFTGITSVPMMARCIQSYSDIGGSQRP